jgi:hypothetical protein
MRMLFSINIHLSLTCNHPENRHSSRVETQKFTHLRVATMCENMTHPPFYFIFAYDRTPIYHHPQPLLARRRPASATAARRRCRAVARARASTRCARQARHTRVPREWPLAMAVRFKN